MQLYACVDFTTPLEGVLRGRDIDLKSQLGEVKLSATVASATACPAQPVVSSELFDAGFVFLVPDRFVVQRSATGRSIGAHRLCRTDELATVANDRTDVANEVVQQARRRPLLESSCDFDNNARHQ